MWDWSTKLYPKKLTWNGDINVYLKDKLKHNHKIFVHNINSFVYEIEIVGSAWNTSRLIMIL